MLVMIQEKKRVAFLSVMAAVFLTTLKLTVGLITGSLGIISEALHSGLDFMAAMITYFSVRISDRPADSGHNYGHGKIENLSALFQTILLIVTCIWIINEAIGRLVSGTTHIEVNIWSYTVVVVSIMVDAGRSRALFRMAGKYNSQALRADAIHFSTDIWSSVVVLIGLISANFGFFFADPVAALIVAAFILMVSFRLGKQAVRVLIDGAPEEIPGIAKKIISTFPEIKYIHSLKIRSAGADTFIKFNIHLDPGLSLASAHEICDRVEKELKNAIPRCDVYIHAEPQDKHHLKKDRNERVSAGITAGSF